MPDLLSLITRRWKMMATLIVATTFLAFIATLFTTKKYMSAATALAANPVLNDRAHIFNPNIEGLYGAMGSADELDRIEGTAKLDTIYLALAREFDLAVHYRIDPQHPHAVDKAATRLKKNTTVVRTGYGELRIRVWDTDRQMAANLANAAMERLNEIHTRMQSENNRVVLQRLRETYAAKKALLQQGTREAMVDSRSNRPNPELATSDSSGVAHPSSIHFSAGNLVQQLEQYAQLINEYELALQTSPKVLLMVESARPSPNHDKPDLLQVVALAFFASLLFSFLLALFVESRNQPA